ncbi:hypothetical protein CHU98_g2689 [Xylaria longipes]|nr:hypothetical protein CHU98_g2689 [Xylaria longipes]
MEAVGTAAAVTELLSLSIKVSKAAKGLVESFVNAPDELVQLATKLAHIQSRIEQLHLLNQELSAANSAVLLPSEHQTVLSAGLKTNLEALQAVQSLCNARLGKSETIRTRWRWAMLDKKKAGRILEKITKAESDLSVMLAILGVRLASLNQMSLGALNASHELLHSGLRESTEAVKELIHVEIQGLIRSPANNVESTAATSDGDLYQLTHKITRQHHSVVHTSNLRRPKNANEHMPNRDEWGRQSTRVLDAFPSTHIEDQVDPGMRLIEHDMRRSLSYHSVMLGSLRKLPTTDKRAIGAMLTVQSKRNRRRLKLVFEIGFKLFSQHVLQFELNLRQAARHWTGMPTVDCSMPIFNVRPGGAPIFRACFSLDINTVRYLLESGQASVYDVDDENGGLLEHVTRRWDDIGNIHYPRVQQMIKHLLDQGCDPSAFYGPIRGLRRNAGFQWKLDVLRSVGYSDWKPELPLKPGRSGAIHSGTILHGACETSNFQETLFALEIAGLDPNIGADGWNGNTPLGLAARHDFLKGAAILVEYDVPIDSGNDTTDGTPLHKSLSRLLWPTVTTHYLLLQGADPLLKTEFGKSAWHQHWNVIYHVSKAMPYSWSFMSLEGGVAHMLLHGSDPFDCFADRVDCFQNWLKSLHYRDRDSTIYLRALDLARAWSYNIRDVLYYYTYGHSTSTLKSFDQIGDPRSKFCWSRSGLIYRGPSDEDVEFSLDEETEEARPGSVETLCYCGSDGTMDRLNKAGGHSVDCEYHPQVRRDELENEDNLGPFFRYQTQFYHHTSSAEGRRRLTRFPMVLALCDGLQFAGYRAEMDDHGDIWYEIDDGDRYFDAQEYQDEDGREDWIAGFCPICRDFEGHGLGHVLAEVEEAKRELREYKEKVKATKYGVY